MKHFSKSIGQCLMTVLMTSTILELYTLPLLGAFDSIASAAPADTDRTLPDTAVIVPTNTLPEIAAPETAPEIAPEIAPIPSPSVDPAPAIAAEATPIPAVPTVEPPVAADTPQTPEANPPIAPEPIASPSTAPVEAAAPSAPEASSPPAAPANSASPNAAPAPSPARLAAARESIANKLAALVNRDRPTQASQLQHNLVALAIYYAQIGEFEDARQVAHHPALPIEVQTAVLAEIDQIVAQLQPQPGQIAAGSPGNPSKLPAGTAGVTEPITVASAVNAQAIATAQATADPGYLTIPAAPELLQPYLSDRCLNPDVTPQGVQPAATGAKPIAAAKPTRSSPFLPIGQHVAAQLRTFSVAANSHIGQPAQPTQAAPPVQISQTVLVSRTAPIRSTIGSSMTKPASPIAQPSVESSRFESSNSIESSAQIPASVETASVPETAASFPEDSLNSAIAPAALNPLSAALPKAIGSAVSDWMYGSASLPLETSRDRPLLSPLSTLMKSAEAAPTDRSLLPEDSYTLVQTQIDTTALPKFIKLTRASTKISEPFLAASPASPSPAAKPTALAQPVANQAADYWRTIATNCGGLQSATQQAYAMSPATNRQLSGSGMIFPLPIPVPITSGFGWRIHPISGDRRFHTGLDLGAPYGTPILSALAGHVVQAGAMGGYGLAVIVEANSGQQQNLYGHLSAIAVKPGDQVAQGSVLGLVGSTGNSTGPHLHFETLLPTTSGWTAVDPLAAAALASAAAPQ
jgi:Peptidase family M23